MNIEILSDNDNLLKEVVKLGTKNSKTLGHFPEGAFIEHAKKGNIICALDDDKHLLGYILFSITQSKRTIRIVHLCISEDHRNKGVAKSLLDTVKNKYSLLLKGVFLSCREDYVSATKFWKKYGFKAIGRRRSKSKKENYLIKWWYDFGNHDLFSLQNADSEKAKALLDANILIKLRDKSEDEQTGSKYLMADWLMDEIDYYFAPEVFNEILRDSDRSRAESTRQFVREFCEAKFNPDSRDNIFTKIDQFICGTSDNDISDKKQLAECIAAEIEYFITTDRKILDADEEVFKLYGVQVLRPTDFILMLDQVNNQSNYVSTRIAGVNFEYKKLETKEIDALTKLFLDKGKGEKKHQLRDLLTNIASNINDSQVKIVQNNEGYKLGFWGAELKNDILEISVIRTSNSKLSNTLFKQLIFDAINYGLSKGKKQIIVSDKYLNITEQETLESLNFILNNGVWMKLALNGITKSHTLFSTNRVPSEIYDTTRIKEKLSVPNENFKCEVERMFWPLKFSDLDIPVYIIPIKPHWASQLFDHYMSSTDLFGALPELVWNRENIYYRSVNPVSEKAPARILWYASDSKNSQSGRIKSVIACSYLDEVLIGEVKGLFQKFKKFGIYDWKDVFGLAKNNLNTSIKALKFSDTEVFKNPVSFKKVNEILVQKGRNKNTFASPLKVNTEIFLEIYKLGAEINKNE